jgi:hypothetical protein
MRKRKIREFFYAKTEIRKPGVISRPTLRLADNNCAQNFATLQLRGLPFLLRRFGMERALHGIGILAMIGCGLATRAACRQRSERAMIGDREPGTDRY